MLWNASNIVGYTIDAADGSVGSIKGFLFDDRAWTVRWVVLDTGTWLSGRTVILPPAALSDPDPGRRSFRSTKTREEIRHSPELDEDAPVSRRKESELYTHYGWDPYWSGDGYAPALGLAAPMMTPMPPPERDAVEEPEIGDRHLRDTSEVTGYYIHAADHDIGHVEDFLIDTDDWTIRYVVVDTRNWWPGRKVLVSPQAFTRIDWDAEMLHTNLTRDQIRNGPDYDPSATVDRAYEERFAGYYGYPNYWV